MLSLATQRVQPDLTGQACRKNSPNTPKSPSLRTRLMLCSGLVWQSILLLGCLWQSAIEKWVASISKKDKMVDGSCRGHYLSHSPCRGTEFQRRGDGLFPDKVNQTVLKEKQHSIKGVLFRLVLLHSLWNSVLAMKLLENEKIIASLLCYSLT